MRTYIHVLALKRHFETTHVDQDDVISFFFLPSKEAAHCPLMCLLVGTCAPAPRGSDGLSAAFPIVLNAIFETEVKPGSNFLKPVTKIMKSHCAFCL